MALGGGGAGVFCLVYTVLRIFTQAEDESTLCTMALCSLIRPFYSFSYSYLYLIFYTFYMLATFLPFLHILLYICI